MPEPTSWDVLANKHVRCAKCQAPVRVQKENGRVILDEIDGSAPHDCAQSPSETLAHARLAAQAAVDATLQRLAERRASVARGDEETFTEPPPATMVLRAERPRRTPRAGVAGQDGSVAGSTSRECPSCGKLMAGSGDTAVCLHCGS